MLKKQLLSYLPPRIVRAVAALPDGIDEMATELRLRQNAPASVTCGGKNRCFDENGRLCPADKALRATPSEMRDCLALLTHSSLYSYGECINQGFLPFGDGNRAGICGDAIVNNGAVSGFRTVSGINLRVSRHVRDCAFKAVRRILELGGVGALIIAPPGGGKTTLLRSIAALLSDGAYGTPKRVAIADERGELCVSELRMGLVDIMSGVPKAKAIELLCRSMSPQFLVCDEIASADSLPLLQAVNSGVSVIASAHAGCVDELLRRPFAVELLRSAAFPLIITLGSDYSYEMEEYKP